MAGAYPGFRSTKELIVLLLPLHGMLVRPRFTPSSISPVPNYTSGWTETMRGKVSRLRKQHNVRDCLGIKPPTFRSEVQHT